MRAPMTAREVTFEVMGFKEFEPGGVHSEEDFASTDSDSDAPELAASPSHATLEDEDDDMDDK